MAASAAEIRCSKRDAVIWIIAPSNSEGLEQRRSELPYPAPGGIWNCGAHGIVA